jgi:CheY-like chemotaxis protein
MNINLSQKERMLLEDQKKHEEMCIQKYKSYANQTQSPELKQLLNAYAQQEEQHLNTVNQILSGQVPNMNQQQGQQQQGQQNHQYQQKEGGLTMQIKILVVDDSASDRLIIKNMLSEYCILTACDGVEAMRVLEEHDGINLLILDLNMPNMNGFQVLESLKEDERFRKLRTIILTNYDELDNEIKGLSLVL